MELLMAIVEAGSVERTLLQAVNKLLLSTGKGSVISVVSPTRHTQLAINAVQDATDDVFYKKLWQWRREHMEIELVEDQMWYALPVDYHKMASPLSLNRDDKMLTYMDYETMLKTWPYLRSFPPGSGVGGLAAALQLVDQTAAFGEPLNYTVWQKSYLGFMPIPDEDFVDTEGTLYGHYWRANSLVSGDYDDIGIPRELWTTHNLLASAKFKKALEMSDWKDDQILGQQMLDERCGARREDQDPDVNTNQQINYNE
jgi:hypothetical protein